MSEGGPITAQDIRGMATDVASIRRWVVVVGTVVVLWMLLFLLVAAATIYVLSDGVLSLNR